MSKAEPKLPDIPEQPAAEEASNVVDHPRRGRGRPKGSRNKVSRDARELLAKHGPAAIRMLCKLAAGQPIYRGAGEARKVVEPTLDQSIAAARIVVDRLVPALKATEHSGIITNPVTVNIEGDDVALLGPREIISQKLEQMEKVRRLAYAMRLADDEADLDPHPGPVASQEPEETEESASAPDPQPAPSRVVSLKPGAERSICGGRATITIPERNANG